MNNLYHSITTSQCVL